MSRNHRQHRTGKTTVKKKKKRENSPKQLNISFSLHVSAAIIKADIILMEILIKPSALHWSIMRLQATSAV